MSLREVRLKSEFAAEYPGISPDVWMTAKTIAELLVARVHARRKEGRFTRTFDPTHFEFRGGDDVSRIGRHRSRSTDSRSAPGRANSDEDEFGAVG